MKFNNSFLRAAKNASLFLLGLALALPVAADSGTWSGDVVLSGDNVHGDEISGYIVPADTGFEAEFDGKYEPSDPDLKDELEDDDDPRASYRYKWTFAPDGQAVGPDDQRQATGKFTEASSAEDDKTVSVEVEVVGEGVTGEIRETFEKSLTAIRLASLTAAEDGSDPENSAVTTDSGDTQSIYVPYTEDAEENSTTVINLAAARNPDGDFPDTLPEWTLPAVDGADELEYEPGDSFKYTAQTPGVYVFSAECGNELTVTVAVTSSDALIAEDKANAKNTVITTEPSDPKTIYVAYVEDEQENPVTEVKLTAVPAPGTAFASGEPEWTVAAVPDGVDAESIDLCR